MEKEHPCSFVSKFRSDFAGDGCGLSQVTHHDSPSDKSCGPALESLLLPDGSDGPCGVRRQPEPRECGDCGRTGDAVHGKSGVSLEVSNRFFSFGTEDSVDPATVEAKAAEKQLELGDIVAPQIGSTTAQQALSEMVCGFCEGAPGLAAHDPSRFKSSSPLERDNGIVGRSAESIEMDGFDQIARDRQLFVQLNDGRTDIATLQTWAGGLIHGQTLPAHAKRHQAPTQTGGSLT